MQRFVEIPAHIEQALDDKVARHLQAEFGDRGLLLTTDQLAQATGEAAHDGERLLTRVLKQCYPMMRTGGCDIEFESERSASRLKAALVFGAATARLLAPAERKLEPGWGQVELLCGVFNLGIGLIDGLCDHETEIGVALLETVAGLNLVQTAEEPRRRGWLRASLPLPLAQAHEVAFIADIVESFFEALHLLHPGAERRHQRRAIGNLLVGSLDAEMQSVSGLLEGGERLQPLQCSRLTSVMPFQIIEALACDGVSTCVEPAASELLGEAMWRIDDLVDICQDARYGALNSILLMAMDESGAYDGVDNSMVVLERLLNSTHIDRAAAQAAENLSAGLRLARGGGAEVRCRSDVLAFLHFVQGYAGLTPCPGV